MNLAGDACNVYGTDIETLALEVDVQTAHRLRISIQPAYLDSSNMSQYILPDELVNLPEQGVLQPDAQDIDLQFSWTNDPTFAFTVIRKSTGDVLFDTTGSVLVYENQFVRETAGIAAVSAYADSDNLLRLSSSLSCRRTTTCMAWASAFTDSGLAITLCVYHGIEPTHAQESC